MKVLCIINGLPDLTKGKAYITKGKWYRVIEEFQLAKELYYLIINDDGEELLYNKSWFKTQQEVREDKLNELGI